ncbi:hypothetical protein UWK_01054 [Desulfocapsa sulfexigens DSM 10523]|uniref:Trypsin-like serine protease with C-terminal PDZ domain n=2 Tax=Desulfocapsa TaxID=53318 RepID=M1PMF7_DESSD|nr:hypothetical protein UWK_01054 [Desulfocapsa sulfexigens DSM 10523]
MIKNVTGKLYSLKSFTYRPFLLILLILILATALLAYLVPMRDEMSAAVDPLPNIESVSLDTPIADEQSAPEEVVLQTGLEISPIVFESTRKKIDRKPDRVPTATEKMSRRVLRSLVYIDSPLGQATGFFIDYKGHILTAGDVAGPSKEKLEKARYEKKLLDQIVVLEQQRLRTIRQKMNLLLPGYEKETFQRLSEEKKKELFTSITRSQELGDLLKKTSGPSLENLSDIKILSSEGKRLKLKKITYSSTAHNLLLLQVNTAKLKYTPLRPRTIPLRAGDRAFIAGYRAESGVLVQEGRVVDNAASLEKQKMLCSDIRIQQEDKGWPLLDRYGNVSGLNSGVFRDPKGNDCAIPIEAAYDAFRSILIPQIRAVKSKIIVSNGKQ